MKTGRAKLLVIDNYDSFTHNLVQMFMRYRLEIAVFRSDEISLVEAERIAPDYLLIGPGPKDPAHAGVSMPFIRAFGGKIPILGVCLGMQGINEVCGGKTVHAPMPVHGKTSRIFHDGTGVFSGLPNPFTAARYHSLAVDPRQTRLRVTARTDDGVVMGIADMDQNLHGVQFHPESFMTEGGFQIVENFLRFGPLAGALKDGAPSETGRGAFVPPEPMGSAGYERGVKWA